MATLVVCNPQSLTCPLERLKELKEKIMNIALAGDFSFPLRIVIWMKSHNGLFANYHEGSTDKDKRSFRLLLDHANEYSLTQTVDKPARQTTILDIIFAENLTTFSPATLQLLS